MKGLFLVLTLLKIGVSFGQTADAYYNRGNAKYDSQDMNGACLDWRKAGELGSREAYDNIKKYCN